MAGRIRDEDVARVRELTQIADVVSEHVTLRPAGGGSLKGLCPFHDEKSPSFNVSPSRGYYHCFGCSEGGDVISFLMKIDHLTFAEAVERLAGRMNFELTYEQGGSAPRQQQGQRTRLVAAHVAAAAFYTEQLGSAEAVIGRTFLSDRGFDREAAAQFGVGYAPNGWEITVKHLRGKGFSDEEIITAGLASRGQRGPVDRFRGRLVWPIRDLSGDIVGFGARKLREDDDGPKYLNTPETPLYKKSQVLYGVDLAKREIAKTAQAVIVEGYTDVMACHLAGIGTAVATCGTAFGDEHVKILRRLIVDRAEHSGQVVYTFDGDAAGQKAALRAFESDQKFVTNTFIAVSPDGMDPCELRLAKGDVAVRDLVDRKVPLFEFAIRSVLAGFPLDIPEGRVAALTKASPLVAQIKDMSLRDEYARRLAGWVGAPDELAVLAQVRKLAAGGRGGPDARGGSERGNGGPPREPGPGVRRPDPRDPVIQVEREALKLIIQRPSLMGERFDALPPESFTDPAYARIREAIAGAGGAASAGGGEGWVAAILSAAGDDGERSLVTELAVEPVRMAADPDARYADELLARLRIHGIDRQIVQVKSRVTRLDPVADAEQYAAAFGELFALEKRRREDLEGGLSG